MNNPLGKLVIGDTIHLINQEVSLEQQEKVINSILNEYLKYSNNWEYYNEVELEDILKGKL
jgi:hypothetical protein